jgi:hypothetical protein
MNTTKHTTNEETKAIIAARYAAALARYNKRLKEHNRAMALRKMELDCIADLAAIREKESKANS